MSYPMYMKLSAQCRTLADGAPTEDLRAAWLRLAQSWLLLATEIADEPATVRLAEMAEIAEVAETATGRTDNTLSH